MRINEFRKQDNQRRWTSNHAIDTSQDVTLTHEDIEKQISEFLSKGGKIQEIPPNVSMEDKSGRGVCNYMVVD